LRADNLLKRRWPCNPICPLCRIMPETAAHLLFQWSFSQTLWPLVQTHCRLPHTLWQPSNDGSLLVLSSKCRSLISERRWRAQLKCRSSVQWTLTVSNPPTSIFRRRTFRDAKKHYYWLSCLNLVVIWSIRTSMSYLFYIATLLVFLSSYHMISFKCLTIILYISN
jgi:hypothetical protein